MQILVRPSTDGLVLQILVRVLFTHTHYYSVFQELGHMQMTVRGHAVHTQSPTHSILIIGMVWYGYWSMFSSLTITHPLHLLTP